MELLLISENMFSSLPQNHWIILVRHVKQSTVQHGDWFNTFSIYMVLISMWSLKTHRPRRHRHRRQCHRPLPRTLSPTITILVINQRKIWVEALSIQPRLQHHHIILAHCQVKPQISQQQCKTPRIWQLLLRPLGCVILMVFCHHLKCTQIHLIYWECL